MQLLTEELRAVLPPIYTQEADDNPVVYARFFTPDSGWIWWVTEGSMEGNDFRFFGYVQGQADEWGYFLLSELESVRGPLRLAIERDIHFISGRFSDVVPAPG